MKKAKKLPEAWPDGPAKTGECPNCGEPYYREDGFSNKYPRCPSCGLKRRGKNHDSGDDHIRRSSKPAAKRELKAAG